MLYWLVNNVLLRYESIINNNNANLGSMDFITNIGILIYIKYVLKLYL